MNQNQNQQARMSRPNIGSVPRTIARLKVLDAGDSCDLTLAQRATLSLAMYRGGRGSAPADVAFALGMSDRQARRLMGQLEERDFLDRIGRPRPVPDGLLVPSTRVEWTYTMTPVPVAGGGLRFRDAYVLALLLRRPHMSVTALSRRAGGHASHARQSIEQLCRARLADARRCVDTGRLTWYAVRDDWADRGLTDGLFQRQRRPRQAA